MPSLAELKASSPAYEAMDDMEFASRIYRKHYAGKMSFPDFAGRVGFDPYKGDRSDPSAGGGTLSIGPIDTGVRTPEWLDRGLASFGKSFVDTGRDFRQVGALVQDAVDPREPTLSGLITGEQPVSRYDESKRQVDAQRALDAPLMDTTAGKVGYAGGLVSQIVGPGLGVKAATAVAPRAVAAIPAVESSLQAIKAASLPTTIKGLAAQGGILGLLQRVGTEDSRLGNTLIGTGGGIAGGLLGRAPGTLAALFRKASPAMSSRAQERAAAKVIDQFAANPAAVRAAAQAPETYVPGSMPTLAEASGDVGLAGLQRTLANTPEFASALAARQSGNNAARVGLIERAFGGASDDAANTIRASRDLAAKQALRPISKVEMQGLDKVGAAIDSIAARHPANQAVQQAMEAAREQIGNVRTVRDAHDFRQGLGQLMSGQVDGKAGAKFARSQLTTLQGLLDRQMRASFPQWGDFLQQYKAGSRAADQVDVGAKLLEKSRAYPDTAGVPQLQAGRFVGGTRDLDRLAQQTTGFNRASADKLLEAPQREAIEAVRKDLTRFAHVQTDGKAIGSNTVQNAIGGNRLQDAAGPVGAAMIEPISGAAMLMVNQMRKTYGERVGMLVNEAMLDPARAAEILARVPSSQRSEVVRVVAPLLTRMSGTSGAAAGGMELDIVGGTPISDAEAQRQFGY